MCFNMHSKYMVIIFNFQYQYTIKKHIYCSKHIITLNYLNLFFTLCNYNKRRAMKSIKTIRLDH